MVNCTPNTPFIERMSSVFHEWHIQDVGLHDRSYYCKPFTFVLLDGVYKEEYTMSKDIGMNIKEGEQIQWESKGKVFIANHESILEYEKVS